MAWERACLGRPSIIVPIADNQIVGAEAVSQAGAGIVLAPDRVPTELAGLVSDLDNAETLQCMSRAAASLVDGKGADRVATALLRVAAESGVSLSALSAAELELVWQWRNDPRVRPFMTSTTAIPWDAHESWFAALDPAKRRVFVGRDATHRPVGLVQFHGTLDSGVAEWGFYRAPDAPTGTGFRLCASGLRHAFGPLGLTSILARVRGDNDRSRKLHERLGFRKDGWPADRREPVEHGEDFVFYRLDADRWRSL